MSSSGLEALSKRPAAYTPEFTYVRGRYTIGSERLSYFSVGMQVQEALKSLVLPRDVVLDPTAPIRMEELFQRELNAGRADKEIVPYLKQARQPKFFNSITVVVLPTDPDKQRQLSHQYVDLPDRPAIQPDAAFDVSDVGPVRIREVKGNPTIGTISWDAQAAKAVIVDGQHRFYAIKRLMDDGTFPYRSDLAETALPVLLLVLDRRAGFETASGAQNNVIQTCRALFIDLNKHAVEVSDARQYLLDDRDLTAVSMRRIMSDEIGNTQKDVSKMAQSTGQIPMALVDWSGERAKFDDGLYLTTTLVLYDIVDIALNIAAPSSTDHPLYKDYVTKLVARLELDARDDFREQDIRRHIDQAEEDGFPYSLDSGSVSAAAYGFRASVGSMVVQPLVGLAPYRALIEGYVGAGVVAGKYEQWLGLDGPGKRAYVEETGENPADAARAVWTDVKARFRLGYQVVFQKGFVAALVEMDRFRGHVLDHWNEGGDPTRERLVHLWIERFNRWIADTLGETEAWAGAGVTAGGTIAWTLPSQRAITGFVIYSLIAPLAEWASLDDGAAFEGARAWLREAWSQSGSGRAPDSVEGLYKAGAAWRRAVRTYVQARFRLREEEEPASEDDFLDHGARMLVRMAKGPRTAGTGADEGGESLGGATE